MDRRAHAVTVVAQALAYIHRCGQIPCDSCRRIADRAVTQVRRA